MREELATYKRGHLIDIIVSGVRGGTKIATYNCKKNTLILYKASSNILITDQFFICASLEQMRSDYEKE